MESPGIKTIVFKTKIITKLVQTGKKLSKKLVPTGSGQRPAKTVVTPIRTTVEVQASAMKYEKFAMTERKHFLHEVFPN